MRLLGRNIVRKEASPDAMVFWHRAQEAGFVDEHFHFTGNKGRIKAILRIFER